MAQTSNGITKESFSKLPVDNKLDVLFDYTIQTHERLAKLEKRKYYDRFISGATGLIAGAGVLVSKVIFWR